ncbi:uncharacterized protein BT62DRAFT_885871 [Guyanagaster necrorhizus]|uniref:GIT Spa2 homology (SHD) domain-containing protein n=1 Tax=Guyanagaster necrorhizus TaxID=856835 RepID=A0A9P8AVQ3_9AGAR|nr:uncharacterized protein BT62DRAFT_885871 [Guyanagaster necrorhizus MCA 3950]KAG7449778.1 hypothetical protein BT62DRAFT_885871 [Guyanagaster necrorhizus MCA 3950]
MKRSQSRAPSPTPTSFSGISNYRTESYRPIRDKTVPAVPTIDYRLISKTHFDELSKYLAVYLSKAPPNSRSTARQKLTRLTIQQFHELSTDVYDELIRRKGDTEVPFLPVREEFHPKRNQARQKLATLPTARFEDLSSDVYFELARRYPEFKEDPSGRGSPGSNYDDYPAPDFPANSPPRASNSRTSGRISADRPVDGGVSARRPSQDRRRPSEDLFSGRTSDDNNYTPSIASLSSRRKPSQDTTKRSDERERDREFLPRRSEERDRDQFPIRRPSAPSVSGTSDSAGTANPVQSATATSGMIIPNKSTMEEEYIEVPYGRDARESGSTTVDDRDPSRNASQDVSFMGGVVDEPDSASDYPSPLSPRSPVGLSALSARLKGVEDEDDEATTGRSGEDYFDRVSYGRTSANSDRSAGGITSRLAGGRASVSEDNEKMRRDYEYKIATMQTQITNMQRELGDSEQRERKWQEGEARVRQMEEELQVLRRRAEEQSTAMRALQKELDDLRDIRQREKEREARRAQTDEDELQILRDRCEILEQQREGGADPETIEQLNSDMQGLLRELEDLSRRNDDLMTAKDSDIIVMRDLDSQLKEYKRKYEQAKTELRSVKATSQLYTQAPKFTNVEDQLPVSSDGGILDIHITAFLSGIDGLLTAARSNAPTRVLTPMKSVVNAVTSIVDDVRAFERRPQRDRSDIDLDTLRSLRERADATLGNLVAASKTHATSSGMSPVSLLDAAASHVSATITEISKIICVRKATKAEQEQFSAAPYIPSGSATNGFSPSLRSVAEKEGHYRKASSSSNTERGPRFTESPTPQSRPSLDTYRQRTPSDNSSSENTNSPPPIFDRQPGNGIGSDDSTTGDVVEDNWAELKPYLEAQTTAVIDTIQSVLSSVRSPTPSNNLNENLTQIITIVSSIVAVCNDNLPPAHQKQGSQLLAELTEHANKLSEVQSAEVTKESRQIMARSSFAVANAMRTLSKL